MGTHPIFESDFDCLTETKMATIEQVDHTVKIKEQFQKAERLAEDVISLKNEVLGLSMKREETRMGWRALQKQTDKTAILNFVPFIEFNKAEAEQMLEKELKVIDSEITTARNALRHAAAELEEMRGHDTMRGWSCCPLAPKRLRHYSQR